MADEDRLVVPEQMLITPELYRRPLRAASLEAELNAFRELSELMTIDPNAAISRFLDLALELCPIAGSAGLSELRRNEQGEEEFVWTAMSGAYAPFVGGTTPRHFSPCGLCLDAHHTILIDRPARLFSYFDAANPPIVEGLVVPIYDTGKRPLGTIWVVSHRQGDAFDATDARIMEQLAVQLVLGIKLRRKADMMRRLEEVAQEKHLLVQEVQHRVKNTIQMTSSLLYLQQSGASAEARAILAEARDRLGVLAKVHEALLQPAEDGSVGLVDMGALLTTLRDAFSAGGHLPRNATLSVSCDELALDSALAIPMGLIVNEAVTNACKHAFPDGRPGNIHVTLRMNAGKLCLSIEDDGVGFHGAPRTGSLGIRLIRSLSRQLGGRLVFSGESGTHIVVRIDKPCLPSRQTPLPLVAD